LAYLRGLCLALSMLVAFPAGADVADDPWRTAWSASPSEAATCDMGLGGAVIEQYVRLSAGGETLRLRLGHAAGAEPIVIEDVTVDGHPVTFAGRARVVVPARVTLWSDELALTTTAGAVITVRFVLPDPAALPTIHWYAGGEGRVISGTTSRPLAHRIALSAIDVAGGDAQGTIITLGDSLTDGSSAPKGELARWPDILAAGLRAAGLPHAVANAGIGGDRLLADAGITGTSPGMLGRLDSDVLALSAPRALIVLAGTNDIGWPGASLRARELAPASAMPSAETIIAGYRQLIVRARARGLLVILGTIPPLTDRSDALSGFGGAHKDRVRHAVNIWIRSQTEADGMIDFDLALRDPAEPDRIAEALDSGDGIHPNAAGLARMGQAALAVMVPLLSQQGQP